MSNRLVLLALSVGVTSSLWANDTLRLGRHRREAQAVALPPSAPADETVAARSYWNQEHLLNDWFGWGDAMRTNGVHLVGDFTTDLLGNPVGGLSQGFAPATSLGLQLQVDLERMLPLPNTEFVTSMVWRTGENLSAEHVGNFFTVAQLYGGENLRLYEFLLRQYLFERQLELHLGRQGAFDQFLAFPIFCNYVNNGTCGSPKGTYYSIPALGQTVYPTASWGAFAKWQGTDQPWYIQAGGYLLDSENGDNDTHGLNWTFDTDLGAAAFIQVGYSIHQKPTDTGLPGIYAVGGLYSEAEQAVFNDPGAERSNGGGYVVLQQMIYRPDSSEENLRRFRNLWGWGGQRGLTAFTVVMATPDDEVSQFPFFINGGLVYQGIIPGRSDDFLAVGYNWGGLSDPWQQQQRDQGLPAPAREVVLELTYRYAVTPFLYVQPDLQWVMNSSIPDALVVGAQLSVTF